MNHHSKSTGEGKVWGGVLLLNPPVLSREYLGVN